MTNQEDERRLTVRNEQTSISEIGNHPLVVRAGFSPQFPERLMQLNDSLRRARALGLE